MTVVISVVSFLIVFSLMVFVHEFGHFIVAKKAGVRVREFGFGFPFAAHKPPSERPLTWMIGKDKEGTVYSINLIPFGGFVNLGENDPDDPRSLANFPKSTRLASLVAGPTMNLLLAFVIFALAALIGYPEFLYGVGIVEVHEGSPAQEGGLQSDDVMLSVGELALNGFTTDFEEAGAMVSRVVEYVAARAGQPVLVLVQRGLGPEAERIEFTVTPRADQIGEGKMGIGIRSVPVRLKRLRASFLGSLSYSLDKVLNTLLLTGLIPLRVLQGRLPADAARTVGPVGIALMTGNAVRQSLDVNWAYPILDLMGVLNVAIAVINLLPLPALDGGHIFFVLLEAVRGKPISPEKEGLVHGVGLALLLLFLVVITVQDIFIPMPQGINLADYFY